MALTAAAAVAMLASAASAQDPQFAAFVDRTNAATPPPTVEAMTPVALATLQALKREEGACVPTALALEPPQTAVATHIITQAVLAGQVKNGWTVYGRSSGCPDEVTYRFMILRMADDRLRAFVVNAGESLANPSLMRDSSAAAAVSAFQAVRAVSPGCTGEDLRMGPTRVADRGADLGPNFHGSYYSGTWTEMWTFRVCGRTAEVPVVFTADGQGGANFSVRGSEARIVQ